jgi:hypothetical protein
MPATTNPNIFAMTLHDLKIGTVMEFRVYHDRSATITVSASPPDMTDIKIVKKSANLSHVSIKVIANGSSGLQVLSNDSEVLFFFISTA